MKNYIFLSHITVNFILSSALTHIQILLMILKCTMIDIIHIWIICLAYLKIIVIVRFVFVQADLEPSHLPYHIRAKYDCYAISEENSKNNKDIALTPSKNWNWHIIFHQFGIISLIIQFVKEAIKDRCHKHLLKLEDHPNELFIFPP